VRAREQGRHFGEDGLPDEKKIEKYKVWGTQPWKKRIGTVNPEPSINNT